MKTNTRVIQSDLVGRSIRVGLFVFLSFLIASNVWAGSKLLNVQGKLTNGGGTALSGNYTITFRMYANFNDPIGNAIWTESQTVSVSSGAFNVTLGSVTALDTTPFNKPYYLGMQVSGDSNELAPRQLLGASAYALGALGDFDAKGKVSASSMSATGNVSANSMTVNTKDVASFLLPTGTVLPFASTSVPTGFLLCDGSAVSRTTYAALFQAIGITWGSGNGSTTFNIPDGRGRALIGSGQGTGLTNRTVGQSLGEETHILTIAEMPSHNHPAVDSLGRPVGLGSGGITAYTTTNGGDNSQGVLTTSNTGGGSAHNNMQPSAVVNFIIKY